MHIWGYRIKESDLYVAVLRYHGCMPINIMYAGCMRAAVSQIAAQRMVKVRCGLGCRASRDSFKALLTAGAFACLHASC